MTTEARVGETPNSDEINNFTVDDSKSVKLCDLCKIDCRTSAELRSHMKTNHKRVLFNCPICEIPMNSKVNLKKHYKSSHTNNL